MFMLSNDSKQIVIYFEVNRERGEKTTNQMLELHYYNIFYIVRQCFQSRLFLTHAHRHTLLARTLSDNFVLNSWWWHHFRLDDRCTRFYQWIDFRCHICTQKYKHMWIYVNNSFEIRNSKLNFHYGCYQQVRVCAVRLLKKYSHKIADENVK